MFQRDYLMRLIEQVTEALGKTLGLRQEKKFEQAHEALDDLLNRLSLPKRQMLKSMPVPMIVEMSSMRGVPEPERIAAVAGILTEDGDVAKDAGEADVARKSYLQAIRLQAEAVRIAHAQRAELPAEAVLEAMLERIPRSELPAEACIALAKAYECYGRYDRAENRWFNAMEREPTDANAYAEGIRFYERLLALAPDPNRLREGGLPEVEVREGLADFKLSFGQHASE